MEATHTNRDASARPAEVTPRERRHALRFAIAGQCFGMPLWHCVITGGLMTLFALSPELRASDLAIGMVNAGLYIGVAALAFAPVLPRNSSRWTMAVCWGLSGVAAAPLLLVPEIVSSAGEAAALFVIALSSMFYAAFYAAGVGGWSPILHTLLPRRMARRFLGVLRMAWQLVAFFAMVGVALVVGHSGSVYRYRSALALFLLAHFARLFFISFIPRHVAAAAEPVKQDPVWQLMKDRAYRRFVMYCALASFLTALSIPSMYVHLIRGLGFGHHAVALVGAAGLFGGLSTFPLWGRLAERRGVSVVYQGALFTAIVGLALWLVPVIFEPDPARREGSAVFFVLACLIFFALRSADAGLSLAFARHAFCLRPHMVDMPPAPLAPAAQWGGVALGVLVGGVFISLAGPDRTALGFRSYQWLFLVNSVLLLLPLGMAGRQEPPKALSADE